MIRRKDIELLAPAGDSDCFKAAIAAGADAIFFGLEQFSARTRAKNLTIEEAKYLIPLAHKHNCRTYLTLNTLLTDSEMNSAVKLVQKAIECGIDAVIVQDMGVLYVLHTLFPDLELHASTQMTTHNSAQCDYLSSLGISQINLSRELSLDEIGPLAKKLHQYNIIPEIFVQGAFCISYSGQCYLSGYLYNEAGNRGSCVQPCRRNWCDSSIKNPTPKDFIPCFHLKDNSAYPIAEKLISQNIPISLKIEGRIKNAEYVWAVTSAWREQIDRILEKKPILKSSPKLTGAINRDYTCGYLEGSINSQMFSSGTKDVSLEKVGIVKKYVADSKTLQILNDYQSNTLLPGDKLTIKTNDDHFVCTATVVSTSKNGYLIQITNKLTKKIISGQTIYKSTSVINSEQLKKILDQFQNESTIIKNTHDNLIPLNISVDAKLNNPIKITFSIDKNNSITLESKLLLTESNNSGLTQETLFEKLTKFGGTIFKSGEFKIKTLESNLFLPLGELNTLRREAIAFFTDRISIRTNNSLQLPSFELNKTHIEKPQEAFLISISDDINNWIDFQKNTFPSPIIILEIPSNIDVLPDLTKNIIFNNPQIVLFFNSILFDDDLKKILTFISALPHLNSRTFICDNTGLAYKLLDYKLNIILGPNCNISNSWNIHSYYNSLQIKGFIPSLELSPNSLLCTNFSNTCEIWYPKQFYSLLMQSRQCLVKNITNCSKFLCDENCLISCDKKVNLKGQNKENITAIKRPGFYSSIITNQIIDYSSHINALKNKISVLIIDKRFE